MTTEEIVDLTVRCRDLSELDRFPTREERQELARVRDQLWTLTKAEKQTGLEGLWRLDAANRQTPAMPAFTALDVAETAAMCELEGTPLAPVAAYTRPSRKCVECGSLVYGDHCTHCHEG